MTGRQILARVRRRWNLDPLPRPRGRWLKCPVCRSRKWALRYWRTHARPGQHRVTHRCDVHLKCTRCSAVWAHGLAIDQATYARLSRDGEYIWPVSGTAGTAPETPSRPHAPDIVAVSPRP